MTPEIFRCGYSGLSDKDRFKCAYPEWQEKRVSSTFFDDFSIADAYGNAAIKDTYKRALNEWKSNGKMLTELVAVLNHKIWQWFNRNNERSKLYDELWRKADIYAQEHLKGDDVKYFYYVLD
jgi:hypothetical protein